MTGYGLGLKRKRKQQRAILRVYVERWKIFSPRWKRRRRSRNNGVFKIGSGHLPQAQHTNICRKSHTITYKPIAPVENPAELEFNFLGHRDNYIELNFVLLLRLKLIKTNGSDLTSAEANTVCCVNNLLNSMFSSLSISLHSKYVTPHETNYRYQTYHENL